MHIYKRLLPLVFLVFAISEARADLKIFMQVPGISGNSTDPAHTGWFDLTSANHGFSYPHSTGTGRVEIADFQDFTVIKPMDINTPALLLKVCKGQTIPTITVDYATAGAVPQTFLKIVFTNVLMRSNSINGVSTSVDPIPKEELRFSFDKIHWTYTIYNADGTVKEEVKAGWDLTTNTSF